MTRDYKRTEDMEHYWLEMDTVFEYPVLENTCAIMRTMKRLIALVIVLLVIGGIAGVTIAAVEDHYAKNKQQTNSAPVATITVTESDQKVAAARTADAKKYQTLVSLYNAQVTECQKGSAAYDKLTVTSKNTTPAPLCAQPIASQAPVE